MRGGRAPGRERGEGGELLIHLFLLLLHRWEQEQERFSRLSRSKSWHLTCLPWNVAHQENETFNGPPVGWRGRQRGVRSLAGRSGMGLEIEICTTEQSEGGRRGRRGGGGLYSAASVWKEKTERRAGPDVLLCASVAVLAQRCHCRMLTSWVWLHSASSKWASVDTEWTRQQKQADSGETVSRDVTGMVIPLIWSTKDNFIFHNSFGHGSIFKGRTSLSCINDVWGHLFNTGRQHLH